MSEYLQSGSSTSKRSAPRRSQALEKVFAMVSGWGATGMTWKDVAEVLHLHHGSASGALSRLHKEGRLARLSHTREACHVYVVPEYVLGRPTQPHGGQAVQRQAAVKAVDAVRFIHTMQKVTKYASDRTLVTEERCAHDRYVWPCPTIAAIERALEAK